MSQPTGRVVDFPDALPGRLPENETVLWTGRPYWLAIARDGLHLHGLAAYGALLVVSVVATAAWRGASAHEVLFDGGLALAAAAIPVLVVLAFAWLSAWTARYVITNRRVVMRVGVALTMSVNLPFARIASAGLKKRGKTGEIALKLTARDGLAALMLWPHTPFIRVEPTLRGLRDADHAGQILAQALAASVDTPIEQPMSSSVSSSVPLAKASTSVDTISHRHGTQTVAA